MIEVNKNNSNNNNNENNNINSNSNNNDNYSNNNNNNKSQLKRKIDESNTDNKENEFELKEFNISKKVELYNETTGLVIGQQRNNDLNNINNNINNNNNNNGEDSAEYSFDYSYNYNMNNNFINRGTPNSTGTSLKDAIEIASESDNDEFEDDDDEILRRSSNTSLATPILGLSVNESESPKHQAQQPFGSPMSISWNNGTTSTRGTSTFPIPIPNSNKKDNVLQNSVGGNSTAVTAMKTLDLEGSMSTITTTTTGTSINNTPIKNNPYEIDPVLKEQYLIEEMKLEKERAEEEAENQKDEEYDHLIFIIHGIGSQVSENRVTTLEQNVLLFKKNCESYHKDSKINFQIIEWHSKLRNENLTDNLEKVSPAGVKKVRDFVNETLLDVLLYMSPLYHQEILNEVSNQINTQYKSFIDNYKSKNGGKSFTGTISIFAHSLGTVITWDCLSKGLVSDFTVENVFAFGSPLGMFLTIQNTPLGSLNLKTCLPTCNNWFNIYSPTDAVAYRIEPFFNIKYLEYDPCLIELEVEKKPLKQKLSGLFFKSSTTTAASTSPTNNTTITTTSSTIVEKKKEKESNPINKKTTTTTTEKQTSSIRTDTEVIDIDSGDENNNTPKETTKRTFKVHPLEPDSPQLISEELEFKDSESSLKSKLFSTLSNVQKSMNTKMPNGNNNDQTPSSPSNNNKNKNSSNPSTIASTASVIKQMIKETISLSALTEPDNGFDKEGENKRLDYSIEDNSQSWTSGLPGADVWLSYYSHSSYWISKMTALFVVKKLIHSSSKVQNSLK